MDIDYAKLLNEAQLEAVETPNQHVRIIAGAGSGKTRVLTHRIAYLIDRFHVDPARILAVTFTNKAAQEMKSRVSVLVPEAQNFLQVSTFHSFCARLLRREARWIGYPASFTILDDDDQDKLIHQIAEEKGLKKSDPLVKASKNYISSKKNLGLYPDDININHNSFDSEKECLEFYVRYEEKKSQMFALDFDDLILVTLQILKNIPEARKYWQGKYSHILIDEFQDTNNTQYELLRLLSNEKTYIYVVGDPDQTIYTWRGANQEIILNFPRDYPDYIDIVLNRNYRSTKNILDGANKLIHFNKKRVPKDLYTLSEEGQPIEAKRFESAEDEAQWVVSKIAQIASKDGGYSNIAMLYRASYLTRSFETEFGMRGIPYRIFGGLRFYQRKEVKDVLAYFRLMVNSLDDISFERIVNVPRRGIGDGTLSKIREAAQKDGVSEYDLIAHIEDHPGSGIPSKAIASLTIMIGKIEETKSRLNENLEAYSSVLRDFITDIGYYTYIAEEQDVDEDRVGNVNALFDDITTYIQRNPESTFVEYLQNISLLSAQDDMNGGNYVSLMTIHCAKGLEFDHVFLVGLNQGVFPSYRSRDEREDGMEEERRLAYVAMTRAKKDLTMTTNCGYSYVTDTRAVPSQFFKEAGVEIPEDGRMEGNRFSFHGGSYGGGYSSSRGGKKTDFRSSWSGNRRGSNDDFFGDGDNYDPFEEKKKPVVPETPKSNGITDWKVGDVAMHEKFGRGVVVQVMNESIIVIQCDTAGKKTLLSSHAMLSRLHSQGGEA